MATISKKLYSDLKEALNKISGTTSPGTDDFLFVQSLIDLLEMPHTRTVLEFDEFKKTRRFSLDLRVDESIVFEGEKPTPGYIYADGLYIEIQTDPAQEPFSLVLENDQWTSSDITSLEERLYEYYKHWV